MPSFPVPGALFAAAFVLALLRAMADKRLAGNRFGAGRPHHTASYLFRQLAELLRFRVQRELAARGACPVPDSLLAGVRPVDIYGILAAFGRDYAGEGMSLLIPSGDIEGSTCERGRRPR